MPTLLEHIAIAGLVALPLARKPKWILLFCWVAILPDLDIFLGLHRIAFHTLLLLIPISVAIIGITHSRFPSYREPAMFIAFCLLSHIILDWLQYWTALLWPIPLAFWLNIQLNLIISGPVPIPILSIGPLVAPITVLSEPVTGTVFNPLDTVLFILFLLVAIIKLQPNLSSVLTKKRQNQEPASQP